MGTTAQVRLRISILAWGIRTKGINSAVNVVANQIITPAAKFGTRAIGREYNPDGYRLAAGYYNCLPEAYNGNEYVGPFKRVSNFAGNRTFQQEEVPLSAYSRELRTRFDELERLMGNGSFMIPERGFFVFLLKDGSIKIGKIIKNDKTDGISEEKIDAALADLLQDTDIDHISRVQFYHGHPAGRIMRIISRQDIDEAIRLSITLADKGIMVAVDMHALPYEMIKGKLINEQPPPIGGGKQPSPEIINFTPRLLRAVIEKD